MPNFLDRWVIQALTEGANQIATNARSNASWSKDIPDAISVGEAVVTSTGYEITIKLDISENGAPEGRAFEYGSGIHSTRGPKATYVIAPKRYDALGIPAERWPGFVGEAMPGRKMIGADYDTGKYILRYVDHPGVAPRAFMTPAILAYRPALKARLLVALRRGFRSAIGKRIEIIE